MRPPFRVRRTRTARRSLAACLEPLGHVVGHEDRHGTAAVERLRAYEALANGDLDAAVELLTEKFIVNLPGLPDPLYGREIWKVGTQGMLDGFPDLRIRIEDIFGVGDKVAVRVRFHGTHKGPFQGVPATHRQVSFTSIEIYRMEGDKNAEEWVSPDMMGLMQQISGPG